MDKFKINIDQPELSDADILKHKSFGNVMKALDKVQLPFYQTGKFWGLAGGGITVATISSVILININTNKPEPPELTAAITTSIEQIITPTSVEDLIIPILPETDVAYEQVMIDPSIDNEIITEGKSILYIPTGSIVNNDGTAPTDSVEISFRDFYSPYEIMLAGIPMEINIDDKSEHLESAGMFQITAGPNYKVAPSKPIQVLFKSSSNDGSYDQYVLNDAGWEHSSPCRTVGLNKQKPVKDPSLTSAEGEIELIKPILEEDQTRLLPIGSNQSNQFAELSGYDKLCLKFEEEDKQFADPELNPTSYSIIRGEAANTYVVIFTIRGKTFEVIGTPAFGAKDFDAAVQVHKDQKARLKKKELERNQTNVLTTSNFSFANLSQEANLILTNSKGQFQEFTILEMGVLNCDRILAERPKRFSVQYNSAADKEEVIKVYSFFPEINSIYAATSNYEVQIQQADKSIVVFICRDNMMGVSYLKDIKVDKKTILFNPDNLISKDKAVHLLSSMI
jgi:hypothetical protein